MLKNLGLFLFGATLLLGAVEIVLLVWWGNAYVWEAGTQAPARPQVLSVASCPGPSAQLAVFGGSAAAQQFEDWYSEWAPGFVCSYLEQGDYQTETHRIFVYYMGGGLD